MKKNKVQNRKNERRNHKNKERELRRKKQFQYNKEKKSVGVRKLWSIPQPEEHTFEGRGYKNLYHFTTGMNLPLILKNGVIFGDVMTDKFDGFNTPNLTTQNVYHLPSNVSQSFNSSVQNKVISQRGGYYRLTIKCPTDPDKLINYGWFDKTYCKGINRKITETNSSHFGDLWEQFIYLGHITPSMITEVKVWNNETKYWDRPRKKEKEDLCLEYENSKFRYKFHNKPSQLRLTGLQFKDYTGMVEKFHSENDHKDMWKDLYELSDVICKIFTTPQFKDQLRKPYEFYKKKVFESFNRQDQEGMNNLIHGIIMTFNNLCDGFKNDEGRKVPISKIDPEEWGNKMRKTHEDFINYVTGQPQLSSNI